MFGALASPNRPPPPHIKMMFLRQKMKVIKGAGNLRPILGTQTFFGLWPTHPPTHPPPGGGWGSPSAPMTAGTTAGIGAVHTARRRHARAQVREAPPPGTTTEVRLILLTPEKAAGKRCPGCSAHQRVVGDRRGRGNEVTGGCSGPVNAGGGGGAKNSKSQNCTYFRTLVPNIKKRSIIKKHNVPKKSVQFYRKNRNLIEKYKTN